MEKNTNILILSNVTSEPLSCYMMATNRTGHLLSISSSFSLSLESSRKVQVFHLLPTCSCTCLPLQPHSLTRFADRVEVGDKERQTWLYKLNETQKYLCWQTGDLIPESADVVHLALCVYVCVQRRGFSGGL